MNRPRLTGFAKLGLPFLIIFSLSALCSSVSIFNLMKNVDESVLQQLQFFSDYAHMVSVDNEDSNEGKEAEAFQKLIFLVRDFEFPEYEFGYHDLRETDPFSKQNFCRDTFIRDEKCAKENLFVRERIRQSYKDVAIFLLPHPGSRFVRSGGRPEDEFQVNMKLFVEKINSPSHLVTKKIDGHEVTGQQFEKYIEAWAQLCKKADQHFPKVQTIAETTAIIQCNLACNTATTYYDKQMDAFLEAEPAGLDDHQLLSAHNITEQEAFKIYDGIRKLGQEDVNREWRDRLQSNIDKTFTSIRKINAGLKEKEKFRLEQEKRQQEINRMKRDMEEMQEQSEAAKEELNRKITMAQQDMDRQQRKNEEDKRRLINEIEQSQREMAQLSEENRYERDILKRQIEEAQDALSVKAYADEEQRREFENEIREARAEVNRIREQSEADQREREDNITRLMQQESQRADREAARVRSLENEVAQLKKRKPSACVVM